MAFIYNPEESNLTNIHNHVGFIIQTIENHDPTMQRVLRELQRLFQEVQTELEKERKNKR